MAGGELLIGTIGKDVHTLHPHLAKAHGELLGTPRDACHLIPGECVALAERAAIPDLVALPHKAVVDHLDTRGSAKQEQGTA